MKRRAILVLSFFIQVAIIFEAYAADTTIKGTGATSATAGLEVTNSSDTSLLYVRNDGNVGIGTTGPGAKLHVSDGAILLDNSYYLSAKDSGGTVRSMIGIDGTNRLEIFDPQGYDTLQLFNGNVGIGTTSPLVPLHITGNTGLIIQDDALTQYWSQQVVGSGDMHFYDNDYSGIGSAVKVTFQNGGNVGIGTTSPGSKLVVNGDTVIGNGTMGNPSDNADLRVEGNIETGTGGQIYISGMGNFYGGMYVANTGISISANPGITTYSTNQDLTIDPNGTGNIILQPTTGNVGIGTTGPEEKLDVAGNIHIAGSATPYILLSPTATNKDYTINSNNLGFVIRDVNSAVDRFVIDQNTGNVGIGTTSPSSALDVAGVIEVADGSLSAPSYSFGNDTDTGFIGGSNGVVQYVSEGDAKFSFDSGGILGLAGTGAPNVKFYQNYGPTAPAYTFSSDADTGLYSPAANKLSLTTAGTDRLWLDTTGNVGIGTTSPGGGSTAGTAVLSIANGTAPVGGVANQASLYAADVAASSELFALDEAGFTTQLSPHDPVTGEWIFYSKNTKTGRVVRVDMERMVKAVERVTGEKFMVEKWEAVN